MHLPKELPSIQATLSGKEEINFVDLIDKPAWKTILLDLVRSEKMDPWNIDIVSLVDRYLQKIALIEASNLRVPANAILASGILLWAKARALRLSSIEEAEELKGMTEEEKRLIEAMLPELNSAQKIRERKISLDELVETIEAILSKTKNRSRMKKGFEDFRFQIPFLQENIEEKIDLVHARILEMQDSQGLVLFSRLLNGSKSPLEVLYVFIPVLFLAHKKKINVWQDEWFGEIFISLKEKAALSKQMNSKNCASG